MKSDIVGRLVLGILVLGIFSFLVLYVLDIRTELNIQPHRRKFGQTNLSSFSVNAAASEAKVFRRAEKWAAEEEALLLRLRGEEKSWAEIKEHFPKRTWAALSTRYYQLTRDPLITQEYRKRWTKEEEKLLLDLAKTDLSFEEITKQFPGRTVKAVRNKYTNLLKGYSMPKKYYKSYTAEEDELILQLHKEGVPWKERVKFFNNRTLNALQNRLKALTSLNFTADEDELLLDLEKEDIPWKERLTYFNNRTLDELRKRFKDLTAAPARSGSKYTPEEDDLIVEAVEERKTIEWITQLVERSPKQVKERIRKLEKSGRIDRAPHLAKFRDYMLADIELIHRLVEKGESWNDITTKYFPGRNIMSVRGAYDRHQARKQKEEVEKEEEEEEEED